MPGIELNAQNLAKEKVADVIPYFRAKKRFKPDDSRAYVTSIDFDDTGELAVTCRTDDTLQIFNCKLSQHAKELRSQKYGAHLARFTHHSSSILYASTKVNHDIRYLSTHDNSYLQYFKGHEAMVTCLTMSPADDGFMSCAEDDTLRLWTLNTQNARGILKLQGAYLAAYDPTASVIAAASNLTQELLLYDLRNFDKAPFSTFDLRDYEGQYNRGVESPSWTKLEFSNDGKYILVGSSGGGHYVLDSFEGQLRHFCKRTASSQRRPPGDKLSGRVLGQGDVCFSPDGKFLLGGSGGDDGILIWDLGQRQSSDNILRSSYTLPFPPGIKDRVENCVYNPRFNFLMTADQYSYMWYPDPELYAPV